MTIKTLHGSEISEYLNELAKLRIEVFREFPYLYDGSIDYEMRYLQTYVNSPNSIAILLFDEAELAGASTGLPLRDESEEFKKPFQIHNYDINSIFYCGESILKKPYRGSGFYSDFFKLREGHASSIKGIDKICFCAVNRPDNHPLMSADYRPLDPVWIRYGYERQPHLRTFYRWKDINETLESDKEMIFWTKKINKN